MNKILICAIILVIAIILYLVYTLYNNYFNSRIESSIKSKENIDVKQPKFKNIDKATNVNKNIVMVLSHSDKKYSLEIELFDKDVPSTCKNFREIAIKGINGKSYKNSIFHRVIKDFMLQGGDIINSNGTGSISIYGDNFKDENFIFKHDKPGLLSMANSGPNTNGSQFFITTVPTPHLDNKHVVFGKVVNGLNYVQQLQNIQTDDNDSPIKELKIISIKEK